MDITKEHLDVRICDFYEDEAAVNTETFREYIRNTELHFGVKQENLEEMDDKKLNYYLSFLDYLYEK
jgi:hypothetical protein